MFDFTINLGNLLTIISLIGGGFYFVFSVNSNTQMLSRRVDLIDAQIENIHHEIKKVTEILLSIAEQKGMMNTISERQMAQGRRLDHLQERVDKLFDARVSQAHGEGP